MRNLILVALLLGPSANVRAEDWPRWRGPDDNGISRETGWLDTWPAGGPPVAWKENVGIGFSSVAVSQGKLYTLGNRDNTDRVVCLDAVTGKPVWSHTYECPLEDKFFEGGPTATPTVDGDRVYTLSRQGNLFAFEKATGKIVWQSNVAEAAEVRVPGWGFGGSPRVHGKLLLLNVGEAGTAVDKETGAVVWKSGDREAGYTTPVVAKQGARDIAILASGKVFQAVEAETGKLLWTHRWLTRFGCNAADPIVSDGQVFISSGYNRGAALLKLGDGDPSVLWENKDLQNQMSSSVLLDGHLYGIDGTESAGGEMRLVAMEFSTGKVKWTEPWPKMGSLMAADGKLILLAESGELVVAQASPAAYKELARAKVMDGKCWTSPVLSGGRIYCRNAAGDVVAVDVRKK